MVELDPSSPVRGNICNPGGWRRCLVIFTSRNTGSDFTNPQNLNVLELTANAFLTHQINFNDLMFISCISILAGCIVTIAMRVKGPHVMISEIQILHQGQRQS